MDKAYIDFVALYRIHKAEAFFISKANVTMDYVVIEQNFNLDEATGLRSDKTVKLIGPKSKRLYPYPLRLVEYYDEEKEL